MFKAVRIAFMNKQNFEPLQPKVVLGVAAHPDDLDFGASGTMAAFAAQGANVSLSNTYRWKQGHGK